MLYQTTGGRIVHRNGLRIVANNEGVIETNDKEIAQIFENMGFVSLDKEEVKEVTPKKKSNAKI